VVASVSDGASQSLLCKAATDEAVDFIKRHKDEPFFLYVPHSYIHGPRFARKELLDKARGNVTRAQIEEVDWSTGQILKTLREEGLAKKTLVIFTSDNGGSGGSSMEPLRGGKGGNKYEGHMRVPTVAWWPGTIAAGSQTVEIATTIDMLPTFAKLAGPKMPTDRVIDGKDVSSLLLQPGAKSPHELLFYEFEGIRRGPWKLVRHGNPRHQHRGYKKEELYNLNDDLGERKNIADQHPAMVKELVALLDQHQQRVESGRRPAATVDNPKPLIERGGTGGIPSLVAYFDLQPFEVGGAAGKKPAVKKRNNNK
jgi:arylsulfatase A